MKPGSGASRSDPKQKALADRIARAVIDCDSSILSLLVVDERGGVLSVGRSKRLAKVDYFDEGLMPKLGVLAKVIMGAAEKESDVMGQMEFLIGAFRNQKIVLYDMPELRLALALRMSRSAIAEYVCNKIAKIVAESV